MINMINEQSGDHNMKSYNNYIHHKPKYEN